MGIAIKRTCLLVPTFKLKNLTGMMTWTLKAVEQTITC